MESFENQTYCFIVSAMRSGSTLLKALIATRPDCSDLPEVHFSKAKDCIDTNKKIIVFKKPAGFTDYNYPEIGVENSKKIVLIRNPYDTIYSISEMNTLNNDKYSYYANGDYLIAYWYMVYNNIIKKKILESNNTMLLRYEDLIADPITQSANVFKFIGSAFQEGTDTYSSPTNYDWKWGTDDGGHVIKTLKVQQFPREKTDRELVDFINNNDEIQLVLSYFGYKNKLKYN